MKTNNTSRKFCIGIELCRDTGKVKTMLSLRPTNSFNFSIRSDVKLGKKLSYDKYSSFFEIDLEGIKDLNKQTEQIIKLMEIKS